MTRLTQDMRRSIHHKIMADLPNTDYVTPILDLVQLAVLDHAPAEVRMLYNNPDTRKYLSSKELVIRLGNKSVDMWRNGSSLRVYGILADTYEFRLQMHDRARGKGLYQNTLDALHKSGLVDKYFAQRDLFKQVSERVMGNLEAAGTVKRLYDVLEPELHGYIPADPVKASLPATVAPVVDDLRKLGKELPVVPKAVA